MTTTPDRFFHTLISCEDLQALNPAPLLLDVSFDLSDIQAGETAYQQAHLPGAHYLHLERDLSGNKTDAAGLFKGRHPLPAREAFAQRMKALGLIPQRQVVAYDGQGGMYAARLWWMLCWIGHAEVAVLDGGTQAWLAQGGAMSSERPTTTPGDYELKPSLVTQVSADELQARLGQLRLIDARAPERFRGEVEPLDKQAGHIPGASNRLFKNNLQADGRFKSSELLHAEFAPLLAPFGSAAVVHQCGSGVTACHNLLAMEHAGLKGSALYPGSWSEWSSDPTRPIAKA